jgi:hypothetical protein
MGFDLGPSFEATLDWIKRQEDQVKDERRTSCRHGRMAKGGHGLPKVSPWPAKPYRSTPCGRATYKTTLQPFQRWPARRAGGLRSSSTPLDTPRRTPMPAGILEGIEGIQAMEGQQQEARRQIGRESLAQAPRAGSCG